MAFDAGFMSAVINELKNEILDAKVEKIYQPEKDAVIISFRGTRGQGKSGERRLYIDAGAHNPRIHMTSQNFENPKAPPMFCMLLRKHLSGAKITNINQYGFERMAELVFEAHDEMGYLCEKYLIAEIMGKYSNLILLNHDRKILGAVKTVDFTTSHKRQVLPGMTYELPPAQPGKITVFEDTEEAFAEAFSESGLPYDKFLIGRYIGISPLTSREIPYLCASRDLWRSVCRFRDIIDGKEYTPVIIYSGNGEPAEYSFFPIKQYGENIKTAQCNTFGELCDLYFGEQSRIERIKQRSSDITRILSNSRSRAEKKLAIQLSDLEECKDKEKYRLTGDIITANLYRLKKGMRQARLINYYSDSMEEITVTLDERMTPAQNAQKYYKKYNKLKSTEAALTVQAEKAREEIAYIATVFDSLTKAENEEDLGEIRNELYESGYASRMKQYSPKKKTMPKPMEFRTSGGYRVLCGKNNSQNDYITHKVASKGDLWFHIKGMPGSHVILICDGGEPPEKDFTEAAEIAAYYSKAAPGQKAEVDYTRVKNIKKPPASKPGYVTYSSNYSAYVTPDRASVEKLKVN